MTTYVDKNGNLIHNNGIVAPNQNINVANLGTWTNTPNELNWFQKGTNAIGLTDYNTNQWQFQVNDTLRGNLGKYTGFNQLSPEQQASFQQYLGQNYSGDQMKNMSGEGLATAFDKWKSTNNTDSGLFGGMFGWGEDKYGNTTLGGATGFQWAGAGLGALQALYGMYQGNKQMKMTKEAFDEQKRLSHANYQMQAKAYNNNLRNQQSGRSFSGMSGAAKRTLGSEYRTRRAKDDY